VTLPVSLADVQAAQARIAGRSIDTPALFAPALSDLSGARVVLKLESRQRTGSFKDRGAANRMLRLGEAERAAGVIAMSAGNHAQAVAYQATRLGIPATIVMPEDHPVHEGSAHRTVRREHHPGGAQPSRLCRAHARACRRARLHARPPVRRC
jgi:threonine dehydratase